MMDTPEYWLRDWKKPELVPRIREVRPEAASKFIRDVCGQHPDRPYAENAARGIARYICHLPPVPTTPPVALAAVPVAPRMTEAAPPAPAAPRTARREWRWIDAAILAALLLLFGARVAHCQGFGPITIQSNGTTVATIAAVGTLNFTGGGTPCSASGITVTCNFASGSSGVSSVGLSMPSQFTVSGSPVTSTGTLTAAWATENANLIFAGPSSGVAATPTFRALVAADLPSTAVTSVVNDTNVTGSISAQALTLGWTGTLAVARGGTGAATTSQNYVFAGPSGASGAPSFRLLVGSDLPNPSATTLGGVESIAGTSHEWVTSISTLGVPALSQPAFTDISGTLGISAGGTGQTTAVAAFNALSPMTTLGDITYESAANTASRLAGNTTATLNVLTQTGTGSASAAPAWDTLAAMDVPVQSGTITTGDCVKWASGTSITDAGAACGSGGSTSPLHVQTSIQSGDTVSTDATVFASGTYTWSSGTFCPSTGTVYHIVIAGTLSTSSADNYGVEVWLGPSGSQTQLTNDAGFYLPTGLSTAPWMYIVDLTCDGTGASAPVEALFRAFVQNGTSTNAGMFVGTDASANTPLTINASGAVVLTLKSRINGTGTEVLRQFVVRAY